VDKLTVGELIKPLTHHDGRLYEVRMRGTVPMTIRGVVWYQGEDDGRNRNYGEDFANMIAAWRKDYRDSELPFYFAQIAQTTYASGMLGVWEGQASVFNTVKHTGFAVANDIYLDTPNDGFKERLDDKSGLPIAGGSNPHPTGKDKIAERLARIALQETYGKAQGVIYGPMVASHKIKGDRIIVTFKHVGDGLKTLDALAPNWFEIADGTMDRNATSYVLASAKITGKDTVEVWADGVSSPKQVRFGWHPLARFNLVNSAGLPAVSFRTDGDQHWRVAGQ
jgi:sialate O-acetylesterase